MPALSRSVDIPEQVGNLVGNLFNAIHLDGKPGKKKFLTRQHQLKSFD
jgi:hypothetical protein